MGNTSEAAVKQTAAASATKGRFDNVWHEIQKWSAEQWRIDLTVAANLTGFCLFPVGWSWNEAPIKNAPRRFPLQENARTIGLLRINRDGSSTMEGIHAAEKGEKFRRAEVGRTLLRMIGRQEIPAFLLNDHDEFFPITDQIRLFFDLNIDIRRSMVGLHDLKGELGWYAETDAKALATVLDNMRAWNTNDSVNDWLVIERIIRSEIEHFGFPDTQKILLDKILDKLTEHNPEAHLPSRSEALARISRFSKEYGKDDSAESEN